MIIQKTKIARLFSEAGLQVRPAVIPEIDKQVMELIAGVINSLGDNQKHIVTPDQVRFKTGETEAPGSVTCDRCGRIKDEFITFAQSVQGYCYEQAKVILGKMGYIKQKVR